MLGLYGIEVGVHRELLVRVDASLHHLLHAGRAAQFVLGGIEVFGPADFAAVEHLHDMRLRMDKPRLLGLVVDHRREDAVRGDTVHERLHHLRGEQEVLFAEEFRVAVDAPEFLHERGVGAEARNRLLVHGLVACDNDDVRFLGRLVEAHVRERDIERLQYVEEQLVVELVGLDPLHPESARFDVAAHLGVELVAEETCHAGDPRVGGNADDKVVLAAVREEERLRVVDVDMDARVVVAAGVPRVESLREIHHLLFDLDAVEVLQQRVGEQVVRTHAASEADHRGVVGFVLNGHGHERGRGLRELVTLDGVLAVLAEARIGLAVRLDVVVDVRLVEADGRRLAVAHNNLLVRMQVLVSSERARSNQVRVETHEDGGQHHECTGHVERDTVAEALAVDDKQEETYREVEDGSKHKRALELQVRKQQESAARRTDNGADRVPAVDLADRGLALEGAREDNRDERKRHAREEARGHHPQHGERVLEEAPADVAVVRRIENLVRLVHHLPERLVEVQRAEGEERHEDLRHREHDERIFLEELAAHGATDCKAEDERRKHLVEAVARRTHQQREQANPDNLVDKRSEARNARNPEPGGLRGHRKLVLCRVVLVQGLATFAVAFHRIIFVVMVRRSHEADKAEHHRKQEVDGGRHAQGNVVAEHRDKHVARDEDADRRTEAVREVEHRERNFGAALAHEARRDKGERHADRDRDGERGTGRKDDLHDFGTRKAEARDPLAIEEEAREPVVQRVVRHAADTDGKFHRGIPEQRTPHLLDHLARNEAADRKAAHVDAEREHLAIAGMPEEEFKVAGPRAFVNETSEPGEGKQEIDQDIHGVNLYKKGAGLCKRIIHLQ